MSSVYTEEYETEHGLNGYRVGFSTDVVEPPGGDWKLCGCLHPTGIHSKSESCERPLEEGGGLEREPVAGEAPDDLHPQR